MEQCGCNEGNSCTEFNIKTQECLIAYLKHINQLSTTEKPWEKLSKRVNLLGSLGPLFLIFFKLYNIESWVFLRYIQCIKALLLSFKVLLLNDFNYSLFIKVHLNINIQISKKKIGGENKLVGLQFKYYKQIKLILTPFVKVSLPTRHHHKQTPQMLIIIINFHVMRRLLFEEVSALTQVITSVLLYLLPVSLTVLITMTLIFLCHNRLQLSHRSILFLSSS